MATNVLAATGISLHDEPSRAGDAGAGGGAAIGDDRAAVGDASAVSAGARAAVGDVGATVGGVRLLLRLEALAMLVAALVLYARLGGGWGRFALLFLVPDLSFLGYLAGARAGAAAYDAAHALVAPLVLALAGLALPALLPYALIWIAHIGFDRALGYGLKYTRGFAATHLGDLHAARRR